MKHYSLIILSVIITIGVIAIYIANFYRTPLSDSTSDWGAWGNYVGIGISIISVSLIYITYKEQQESNRIGRFEEHYHVALKTLTELLENKKEIIVTAYNKIEYHFRNPFDPLTDYKQSNTQNILGYYYFSSVFDIRQECDEIFRYFFTILSSIQHSTILEEEEKNKYFTEVSCVLPEYARILFLCWGCYYKQNATEYYKKGLYRMTIIKNTSLHNVIKFACTNIRPQKEATNMDDIELDDYSNEEFQDTYKRFFNNKNKQQ